MVGAARQPSRALPTSSCRERLVPPRTRSSCQVRERARRSEDPSLVVADTQSVRAAAGVPKAMTGLDANERTPGRKRGLAVDVLGLIIGAERCGNRLEKALVDQGFKDRSTAR